MWVLEAGNFAHWPIQIPGARAIEALARKKKEGPFLIGSRQAAGPAAGRLSC